MHPESVVESPQWEGKRPCKWPPEGLEQIQFPPRVFVRLRVNAPERMEERRKGN